MVQAGIHEVGEIIRKVRKEQGLRLEDLADENISPATISNIERGVPHVSPDKAMYILKKLDLSLEKIPELKRKEQQELEKVRFRLLGVDSVLSTGAVKTALDALNALTLEESHPYAATACWLKGRAYRLKENPKRAERALYKALQLSGQQMEAHNIEAACYLELSLCYGDIDLEKALQYTVSGLDAYYDDGERPYLKYDLLLHMALYLYRLGRISESFQVVTGAGDPLEKVDQSDILITFYWLRSELARKLRLDEEAVSYAYKGLDLAGRMMHHNLMFDLWKVLGDTYMDRENWSEAEYSFQQALKLSNMAVDKEKFIIAYTSLGLLHSSQQKWDQAESVLLKAVELGELLDHAPQMVTALQALGDCYRQQGEKEKASPLYQRSLDLATFHGFRKKEYTALYRLAECWEGLNEQLFQEYTANLYSVQKELEQEGAQFFDPRQ